MKGFLAYPVLLMLLIGTAACDIEFAPPDRGFDAIISGDYGTALKEYMQRAEQGDNDAQNGLGILYSEGWGVVQDNIRALMWFMVAASNGNLEAIENHSFLEKKMTTAQIAQAHKIVNECMKKTIKIAETYRQ